MQVRKDERRGGLQARFSASGAQKIADGRAAHLWGLLLYAAYRTVISITGRVGSPRQCRRDTNQRLDGIATLMAQMTRRISLRTLVVSLLWLLWLPTLWYFGIERVTVIDLPGLRRLSFYDQEVQGTYSSGVRLLLPYGWPQVWRCDFAGLTIIEASKGNQTGWYIWIPYWPVLLVISIALAWFTSRQIWKRRQAKELGDMR